MLSFVCCFLERLPLPVSKHRLRHCSWHRYSTTTAERDRAAGNTRSDSDRDSGTDDSDHVDDNFSAGEDDGQEDEEEEEDVQEEEEEEAANSAADRHMAREVVPEDSMSCRKRETAVTVLPGRKCLVFAQHR